MKTGRGFTLIELLVVITIIAILAAILFPVFNAAREKGRSAACAQNIRQLCMAVLQYADDYDDHLPVAFITDLQTGQMSTWYQGIFPYVENYDIWQCPSEPDSWLGYGYNFEYLGYQDLVTGVVYSFTTGSIRNKARTIMLTDTKLMPNGLCSPVVYPPMDRGNFDATISKRHNMGCNVAHVDGHAKWFSYETLVEHTEWWDREMP